MFKIKLSKSLTSDLLQKLEDLRCDRDGELENMQILMGEYQVGNVKVLKHNKVTYSEKEFNKKFADLSDESDDIKALIKAIK